MNTEDRLIDLESHLAHQDRTISDLNDVIISQQRTIDNLEARLQRIENNVKQISLSTVKDISEETPPPHY